MLQFSDFNNVMYGTVYSQVYSQFLNFHGLCSFDSLSIVFFRLLQCDVFDLNDDIF